MKMATINFDYWMEIEAGYILHERVCPFLVISWFYYFHGNKFHGISAEICIGLFLGHIES